MSARARSPHRPATALTLAALAALLTGCSSTAPSDEPVIWGGWKVEVAITETAIHVRRACIQSRFSPRAIPAAAAFVLDGVVTSSTSGTGIGMVQKIEGRTSGDSMFITGANYLNGEWTTPSKVDTLRLGTPGDFTAGRSCIA